MPTAGGGTWGRAGRRLQTTDLGTCLGPWQVGDTVLSEGLPSHPETFLSGRGEGGSTHFCSECKDFFYVVSGPSRLYPPGLSPDTECRLSFCECPLLSESVTPFSEVSPSSLPVRPGPVTQGAFFSTVLGERTSSSVDAQRTPPQRLRRMPLVCSVARAPPAERSVSRALCPGSDSSFGSRRAGQAFHVAP